MICLNICICFKTSHVVLPDRENMGTVGIVMLLSCRPIQIEILDCFICTSGSWPPSLGSTNPDVGHYLKYSPTMFPDPENMGLSISSEWPQSLIYDIPMRHTQTSDIIPTIVSPCCLDLDNVSIAVGISLKAEKYDISCYFISTSGYRPPSLTYHSP